MKRFKTLLKTLLVGGAALLLTSGEAGAVRLGANCIVSKVGFGMYTMDASSNPNFTRTAETLPLFGGAVYVNGKYYGCYYDYDYVGGEPQLTEVTWNVYDAVTWRLESTVNCPLDFRYIATDRTYDPSTGKVYSLVYDQTASAVWLSTTNLQTGEPTMIAPVGDDVFMIAADAHGKLYGINTSAKLFEINASTGATTLIGSTNIMADWYCDYQQSITFDHTTGKLYWAEFHALGLFDSAAALYEINPATAATTKIADLPGGPELTGLYVIPSLPAGTPGLATNLKATPQSTGSTSVVFSFTAPTRDVDGNTLDTSKDITFELAVDNDVVDIASVKPGASYTTGAITVQRGLHAFKVTGSNDKGVGDVAAITFYSGYDVPAAPKNVKITSDGTSATLTWSAPTEGSEGGPIRSPYTYNVYRYPGGVKVANGISALTYTDTPTDPSRYYYEISAVSQDGEGLRATSDYVVLATFNTPYYCGFDTEDEFNLYTIVDLGSQGKVWNYDEDNGCLRHPWGLNHSIDDYAMTPAIRLDGNKSYNISFDAWQMVGGYDEHVMLYYGTEPDINSMTLVLDTQKLNEGSTNYSAVVAAKKDGVHYFAFRSKTGANGFMSYVDNIRVVEEGMATAPESVKNLKVKAADGGRNEVTVSFDAPSLNLKGDRLTSLTAVDILRGEGSEPIKTFNNPAVGSSLEWTDQSVRQGKYTYRVVAINSSGSSQEVSAQVYVGVDTPNPVTDLLLTKNANDVTLTWNAPEEGVNGGNLNGLLTYKIERYVNNVPTTLTTSHTDTQFTDTWQTPEQAYVYYAVTAQTTAGSSSPTNTNGYTAGEAYGIPFMESFAGGEATNKPWMVEQVYGNEGSWTIVGSGEYPWTSAQDGDGGMATFDGYHYWARNCELRLISPAITFEYHKNLVLNFYAYHYNGVDSWSGESEPVDETFCIEASVDGGPFEKVKNSDFATYDAKNGWQQHSVQLEGYDRLKSVRIAFRGKSAGCFNIHIDNISIEGTLAVDGIADSKAVLLPSVGKVVFSSLEAPLVIFSIDGKAVARTEASEGNITLDPGIYVARSGDRTWKFVIR